MKEGNTGWQRKPILVVAAIGILAGGLALQGAPPRDGQGTKRATSQVGILPDRDSSRIVIGPGIPRNMELPVFDPIAVDYRDDDKFTTGGAAGEVSIGAPSYSVWDPSDKAGGARTGIECQIDEQCGICDVCYDYECTAGKCVATANLGTGTAGCDDGLYCNGDETCVDEAGDVNCLPGTSIACTGSQVCDEAQDACVDPCTSDASCDDENDCTADTCDIGTGLCSRVDDSCYIGRCCADDKVCQALTRLDCEAAGGVFLATSSACEVVQPSGNLNACPKYGTGIAPQGDYLVEVGPVSGLACDNISSLGDDYETQNYPESEYMDLSFLRFAGSVLPLASARWQVAFYDQNGVKIEDVFWPDGTNDASPLLGIRTVDFDPPLTIPTKGYVVWSVQANFGLDGRVMMLSTTCPAGFPDKGNNDCGKMWVNGASVTDFLGVCLDGDNDGQRCDRTQGNNDCPGGTCEDLPDVLAFELIGTKTSAPLAACCDADLAECRMELPWDCDAQGDNPGEVGTLCGICPNGTTPCADDSDCDPPDPDTCLLIPACEKGACCNADTGACDELADAAACAATGLNWQGFGTDCDPDCCLQPVTSGRGSDNCMPPAPAEHVIQVPVLGDAPVSITITGSNVGATFGDFPDFCDSGIFDPDGDTLDTGWWEIFEVRHDNEGTDDCFEVRVDLCCTDIDGQPLRPQWGALVRDEQDGGQCCDTFLGSDGVDPPIGVGRGTSGFARGGPFCGEDNLWSTFGPLRTGKYTKPIYSAPNGTSASPPGVEYQMHITVGACPIAACCVAGVCSVVNEIDCEDMGGYWMFGNAACGLDANCETIPIADSDNPCCTGSCCRGPGDCQDTLPGPQPMSEADCINPTGDFVGGATCDGVPPHLPSACPICTAENDGDGCQPNDTGWHFSLDRINGGAYGMADDFIANGNEIRQVCWWGNNFTVSGGFLVDCDPGDIPEDNEFEIRFYEDAGGLPGALIAGSPGPVTVTASIETDDGEFQYSVVLDSPIPVTAGNTYWFEISAAGNPDGSCRWWMGLSDASVSRGNGWSMIRGFEWQTEYTLLDRLGWFYDLAFCLDTGDAGFDIPAVTGACCKCNGDCTSDTPVFDCLDSWNLNNQTVPLSVVVGEFTGGEDCAAREVACDSRVSLGDACTEPETITDGLRTVSTVCASTDGSPELVDCDSGADQGDAGFYNDVWLEYHAECTDVGALTLDMCLGTDFDVVFEVFSNGTSVCPTTCPPDPADLVPNFLADDHTCTDFLCEDDAGPSFQTFADPGQCYLIRIGGSADNEGEAIGKVQLDVLCETVECPVSFSPAADASPSDIGFGAKNRYLSIDPSILEPAAGSRAAQRRIQVTFLTLPGYEYAEGRTMWVQEPFEVTENSGGDGATPAPTHWAADLGCNTYETDWSAYGVIDIADEGIVPGGVYEVRAIDPSCQAIAENFSAPPLVVTQSLAGDLVGSCATDPCTAPDGLFNFVDISGVVDKFKNLVGAPRKARADLVGVSPTAASINRKADFVDIGFVVDAFRSQAPAPDGPPVDDPCAQ